MIQLLHLKVRFLVEQFLFLGLFLLQDGLRLCLFPHQSIDVALLLLTQRNLFGVMHFRETRLLCLILLRLCQRNG